jgi:predicted nucleic acid-binding protein
MNYGQTQQATSSMVTELRQKKSNINRKQRFGSEIKWVQRAKVKENVWCVPKSKTHKWIKTKGCVCCVEEL